MANLAFGSNSSKVGSDAFVCLLLFLFQEHIDFFLMHKTSGMYYILCFDSKHEEAWFYVDTLVRSYMFH